MKQPFEQTEKSRVAMISLHTSPRDQPGTGDSGGMNVYILSVAERLAEQGIAVDVFTRCRGEGASQVEDLAPGSRLIRVQAGPCAPVPKEELPRLLPDFLGGILTHAAVDDPRDARNHPPYDVVHSHYWLSGWVGARAKEIWGVPHVTSFHTLGKVKNGALAEGDRPEPPHRVAGEQGIVRAADRILAPTTAEATNLVKLYAADPGRIRIVSPGVDRRVFAPQPRHEAKVRLGMAGVRLVLFVGRLQPLKGPDVAIAAMAEAVRMEPEVMGDVVLAVVGGPSGAATGLAEIARLERFARRLGMAERVLFFPAQPHERLADFYSAAEMVLMPSRTESFGLVALEAHSCGTPVIGASVAGLRAIVADGETGYLLEAREPAAYARRIVTILADRALAERMGRAAAVRAGAFSWDATTREIHAIYDEVASGRAA
ncbi:D-inositol-3-phosphate glycosyltransferase [soil metagenome]